MDGYVWAYNVDYAAFQTFCKRRWQSSYDKDVLVFVPSGVASLNEVNSLAVPDYQCGVWLKNHRIFASFHSRTASSQHGNLPKHPDRSLQRSSLHQLLPCRYMPAGDEMKTSRS